MTTKCCHASASVSAMSVDSHDVRTKLYSVKKLRNLHVTYISDVVRTAA